MGERRLMYKRLCVWIPQQDTGWTCLHVNLLQKSYCLFEKTKTKINEKEVGNGPFNNRKMAQSLWPQLWHLHFISRFAMSCSTWNLTNGSTSFLVQVTLPTRLTWPRPLLNTFLQRSGNQKRSLRMFLVDDLLNMVWDGSVREWSLVGWVFRLVLHYIW